MRAKAALGVALLMTLVPSGASAVEDDPASAAIAIHALLDAGDWPAALEAARALAVRAPDDRRARTLLAEALFRAGRLDEIEAVLSDLAGSADVPGRALMTLGRLRDAQGREAEAVELMRRAVAAAPDDRDVLFQAAGATATRAEAVERLRRYLERCEGDDEETIAAARGQLRLFEALGDKPVWTSTARPPRIELPLEPLWIPETGQVVGYRVEVRLGEKRRPVKLLLDSGSPGLYVIERVARKAGFAPIAQLSVFGGGGQGRHTTTRGFFSSLAVGRLEFGEALASSSAQELDPEGRYHGLLGLSIFNGYRMTLDLARRRLTLVLGKTEPLSGGTPYYTVDGQILVSATTSAGEGGLFLFDTGSTSTLVSEHLAARLAGAEFGEQVEIRAFGGARRGSRELRGVEVQFQGQRSGTRPLRAVDLSVRSQVGGVEIVGFVGLDMLDGRRIEIDTLARTLALRAD